MISVGSHRLDAVMWIGPACRPLGAVSSTVATQIANRITGNAQITSIVRESTESDAPP